MTILESGFADIAEFELAGGLYRAIQAGKASDDDQITFTGLYADKWHKWQQLRTAELRQVATATAQAGAPIDPAKEIEADMLAVMRASRVPTRKLRPAGSPLVDRPQFFDGVRVPARDISAFRSSNDRADDLHGVDRIAAAISSNRS